MLTLSYLSIALLWVCLDLAGASWLAVTGPAVCPRGFSCLVRNDQQLGVSWPYCRAGIPFKCFRYLQKLADGSFGSIILAQRKPANEVEEFAAVKVFKPRDKNESENDYENLIYNEFNFLQNLHHPNIIKPLMLIRYKADQRTGLWTQLMEYAGPKDIQAMVAEGRLSAGKEVDCVFAQIVSAVSYLHEKGIAHRDLSLANIILREETGLVKLLDFGCALRVNASSLSLGKLLLVPYGALIADNQGLEIKGNPAYLAPEILHGEPYSPMAADVWALGIILIGLLTAHMPWEEAVPDDVNFSGFLEKPRDDTFKEIPETWRSLVRRMVNTDPRQRATISEVLADPSVVSMLKCRISLESNVPKEPLLSGM